MIDDEMTDNKTHDLQSRVAQRIRNKQAKLSKKPMQSFERDDQIIDEADIYAEIAIAEMQKGLPSEAELANAINRLVGVWEAKEMLGTAFISGLTNEINNLIKQRMGI